MNSRTSFRCFVVLGALATASACSSDRDRDGKPPAAPTAPGEPVRAFLAHRDARTDAPSFVWLAKQDAVTFADAREAATTTLASLKRTFNLTDAALASVETTSIDDYGHGPIVARFRQRAHGLEVFRGGLAIALSRTFEPVSASGFLARSLAGSERAFARTTHEALGDATKAMNVTAGRLDLGSFTSLDVTGDYERFTARGLAEPARVKKVLYPQGDGVVPAYYVELQTTRGPAYSYVVAASDGRVLFENNLVRGDSFGYRAYADPTTKIPFDGPQGNGVAPHLTGTPDGFKPTFGPSNLVTLQNLPFSKNDPWLPPDATTTTGNNVRAYPDMVSPDGASGDAPAPLSSTGPNVFDYTYETTKSPGATAANIQAATTHLFYVTNFLHDWYYDHGFDEKSGNHQTDNFGRGGQGRDALKAEAQDFAARNNADATVPADGASPRIQMYVFSGPSFAELKVLTPPAIAASKSVGLAGFGNDQFDTSGSVVVAVDEGGTDVADACEPLINNVAGKIVLVHRGLCPFVQKAQNVQSSGGIGVIVANVASSAQPTIPPFMGGTSSVITIPILSLAVGDGQALEAAVPEGVTVEMRRELQTDLDGSLDTTIVVHEWGHVMSGRLIADGSGLSTNQSGGLGEGWADFTGLLLMVRGDDITSPKGAAWMGAYPNGAYATSGAGSDFYFGIRRVPYSIDLTKDPLTLKHIASGNPLPSNVPISFGEDGSFNSEVHATGEVWATMLWECYASLLRDPRYTFDQAQDRMKRYLVASLKLTPPDPTILEARDAVLAAALATDEKDFRLFWDAFGRRGAGVGAEGPAKDSANNGPVKESFFVGNDVQISNIKVTDSEISCDHDGVLDEGEVGVLSFDVRNAGPGTLNAAVAKLSSKTVGVSFEGGDTIKLDPLKPFAAATVKIRTQIHGAKPIDPVTIDVEVSDPSFPAGRVQRSSVAVRYQADEAPNASTVDHVDTRGTSWVVFGEDTSGATKKWSRVSNGLDGKWIVPNGFEPAEHRLTSPRFEIEGTTFTLAFTHRWSFRISARRMADIDGGVIEITTDKGKTWKDISTFGKVDYTSTLDQSRGDNTLKGRRAYGNKSPGYPDAWVSSRINVDLETHPETVAVRFLFASGTGFSGAPGWEIDEIDVAGLLPDDKPFWSYVGHADLCDEKGPTAIAPAAATFKSKTTAVLEGSGTHPTDLPITFAWSQVEGPPVAITNDGSAKLTFVAPETRDPVKLTFALRANDGKLLSPASLVDVTIIAADAVGLEAGGGGCSTSKRHPPRNDATTLALAGGALGLLALGVLVRRRHRRP